MSTEVVLARARIGLLGCGNVGSELVRLLTHQTNGPGLQITRALVRDPSRFRGEGVDVPFTTVTEDLLADRPDVIVELLGGCEPARQLVVDALSRRIPVVTANKSLLARHGRELREAARRHHVPLLYEAAVLAGVPFLGTFARRPLAAGAHALLGIVNGTSNFVLTQCARQGLEPQAALADAQRLGYAEPDPANDIGGLDAAEKLVVLLQHFAGREVALSSVETRGIGDIAQLHHALAAELGGAIKPVITADWTADLRAFAGPAFVPASHPLHGVAGVDNALLLETARGRLLFQGPGAGPLATAATVIDDVHEVVDGVAARPRSSLTPAGSREQKTGWLIALAGRLPSSLEIADYLSAHAIYIRRSTERHSADGREWQGLLTWPCARETVARARHGIEAASGISVGAIRALETLR
jgi:homoserine dehydrogenase